MIKHSLFVLFAVWTALIQLTLIVLKCCDLITANWHVVWVPSYVFIATYLLTIIIYFLINKAKEN